MCARIGFVTFASAHRSTHAVYVWVLDEEKCVHSRVNMHTSGFSSLHILSGFSLTFHKIYSNSIKTSVSAVVDLKVKGQSWNGKLDWYGWIGCVGLLFASS